MKFTPLIVTAILAYCTSVEAAPTPNFNFPSFIPGAVRGPLGKIIDGVKVPALVPETARAPLGKLANGLNNPLPVPESSRKPINKALDSGLNVPHLIPDKLRALLDKIVDDVAELPALIPGEVREPVGDILDGVHIPAGVPEDVRSPANKIMDGFKNPSSSHSSGLFKSLFRRSEDSVKTRGFDLSKLLEGAPDASSLNPEELRRPLNPGSVSGLVDRSEDAVLPRSPNVPSYKIHKEDEMTERVRGHDRLNEAERKRQVQKILAENPSMKLRQKDIDRITNHMLPDAISDTLEKFCMIVEKGVIYYELSYKNEDFTQMCKAKYDDYNAFYEKHKVDSEAWETLIEELAAEVLDFTNDDWVRIFHEDKAELAANYQEFIQKMKGPKRPEKITARGESTPDIPSTLELENWGEAKFKTGTPTNATEDATKKEGYIHPTAWQHFKISIKSLLGVGVKFKDLKWGF